MLSGIRTGKKKRKTKASPVPAEAALKSDGEALEQAGESSSAFETNKNVSAAAKLKAALASGSEIEDAIGVSGQLDLLEQRGRIQTAKISGALAQPKTIVVDAMKKNIAKNEDEMTVQELTAQERQSKMSWDEQMTRNLARLGKKKRLRDGGNDSDEEVQRLQRLLPGEANNNDKSRQRERHAEINSYRQQDKVTSKCSWWIESSSFSRHRLLALGNFVSLVMAPSKASLSPGHHFYIVPLKHSKSFVDCDDHDAWKEVQRFHDSLQKLYAKKGKSIILIETVLPYKGFWQTKIEAIPVPFAALQDAPIFFKSAMAEQMEAWGTHDKILSTTAQKPLHAVIPKNFPYFFVYWGNIATSSSTGFAQIIEASDFRNDFGLDTLAGMMDMDPVRARQKLKISYDEEQQSIADFLSSWKPVDWTRELDNN